MLGGEDRIGQVVEGIVGNGGVFLLTEDQADVGVGELAEFEVYDDQTAQGTVEEEQVHAEPLAADPQAALTADKGEVAAEFEQEVFQVTNKRVFKLAVL